MGYLVLAAIAVLFFMLAPLMILIQWLLRKRKGSLSAPASYRLLKAAIMCGTILTVNILYLLVNALINENMTVGQMNFGVALNWILVILGGTLIMLSFVKGKHQTGLKRIKRDQIGVAVLFSGFALLLANWHFFHFIQN
ncbi:hypothetical protein D3C78_1099580 [compost metagenome]